MIRYGQKRLVVLLWIIVLIVTGMRIFSLGANDSLYAAGYSSDKHRASLKFGYVSREGAWVAWPVYDSVVNGITRLEPTENGYLYPAKYHGKCGYLNARGEWEIAPQYHNVREFRCNRAIAYRDKTVVIDPHGEDVFTVEKGEKIGDFSEGLAWKTVTDEKTGEQIFGYVDVDNHWVISPRFPFDSGRFQYYQFSEGAAQVYRSGAEGTGYDYIDRNGELLTRQYFEEARPFSEGCAAVKQDGKWGYIEPNGNWKIPPQYQYAWPFSEGLGAVIDQENHGKYIDQNGTIKLSFHYYGLLLDDFRNDVSFHEGLAGVYESDLGGQKGYIDKSGRWAISPQFAYTGPFQDGIAYVQYDGSNTGSTGTYGYIDQKGNCLIKWEYW